MRAFFGLLNFPFTLFIPTKKSGIFHTILFAFHGKKTTAAHWISITCTPAVNAGTLPKKKVSETSRPSSETRVCQKGWQALLMMVVFDTASNFWSRGEAYKEEGTIKRMQLSTVLGNCNLSLKKVRYFATSLFFFEAVDKGLHHPYS